MGANPQRHREQLVRALDDDGLEELALRLARVDYPDAHRTARGVDGGVDVLSDYETPPARAWQAKTSENGRADWTKCRASIRASMAEDHPPGHYTFVFNHALTKAQRDFWRDDLLPELRRLYPDVDAIDYWDDLDRRVEPHPGIVDWLTDGAYGNYVRTTLQVTAQTGVNPIANAVDLADGLGGVAAHAAEVGRTDPRFAYGEAGREADAGDTDLRVGVERFSLTAGQRDALPTFKLAVRSGEEVQEVTARPRAGVEVRRPEPWFADDDDGRLARAIARSELAKGRPVAFEGAHVGLAGGDVPDRFAEWMQPGRTTRAGQLELGLSDPLEATATLTGTDGVAVAQTVMLYRVPTEVEGGQAYAGAVGSAVLSLDLIEADPPTGQQVPEGGRWLECSIAITLAFHGDSARTALRGLGFAKAFGEAPAVRLECPGLLPAEGYGFGGAPAPQGEATDTWQAAATIALALDALRMYDGVERTMPDEATARDLASAELVLGVLMEGGVRLAASGEFRAPLPPEASADDPPERWVSFEAELPPFAGQATGLQVVQHLTGATAVRIEQRPSGSCALVCRADRPDAAIELSLAAR